MRVFGSKETLGFLACLFVLFPAPSYAEPYLALRAGEPCDACHTNMTGGGKRTDLVAMHAREILRYPRWLGTFFADADRFTGELHPRVSLGADLRTSYTALFQDEPDERGLVENNTAFRDFHESRLDVTQATGFLELELFTDRLALYVDQRLSPTTDNREAFALLRGLPWNGFLKVGRMFLPYGLQLQDDRAFVRDGYEGVSPRTGFSFDASQGALELGIRPGPFRFVTAVSEGRGGDRDVQWTGTGSLWLGELPWVDHAMLGGSFSLDDAGDDPTWLLGAFGGLSRGPVVLLAEVDFRSEKGETTGGGRHGTFLAYAEANYLLFGWLNAKLAFDYADDDGDLRQRADDSENRLSVGFEPFLSRFLQLRFFYRVGNGVRSRPEHNRDELLAEAHLFF
ncbi:MAG: hypothetical protein KatS3mg076_0613 [Candidatus Binatia bacterium]|nr:MAG: hypothetical protein KatS3mg076_0613 [Candidatus Binatia bacterium]